MATKKKVKAVEPEVFSSVEPEVAALNMNITEGYGKVTGNTAMSFKSEGTTVGFVSEGNIYKVTNCTDFG